MTIVDQSTADTANSIGITINAGASAHIKGDWVELISSTSEETYWHTLAIKGPPLSGDDGFLIDIGLGEPGSEIAFVDNVPFFANLGGKMAISFPQDVPASSRISARCQSTSSVNTIEMMSYHSNDSGIGRSTINQSMGANNALSRGTTIDPGPIDNTKGLYEQLIASTSDDFNYFLIFLGNNNNNSQSNQVYLIDLGVGSTPVVQIANVPFTSGSAELISTSLTFHHTIPAGEPVHIRCQSSAGAAAGSGDRLIDVMAIGFKIELPATGGGAGLTMINGRSNTMIGR